MMNRKIGMYGAMANLFSVVVFALSMLFRNNFVSYFSSILIALSFVLMMCAYLFYAKKEQKLAGIACICFAGIYAAIISLVYFAQLTTVRLSSLSHQAAALLDFQLFGLYFNYDLLGYAFMSLATFFAGLSLDVQSAPDKALKTLLLLHGLFFITCFIIPMLGLFQSDVPAVDWVGTAVLEFWCAYFIPISTLSFIHFVKYDVPPSDR